MKRLALTLLACLLILLTCTATATAASPPTLKSLAKEIKAVNALQTRQIKALDAQLAKADATIAAIQANKALLLGPYVSVTSDALNGMRRPHILFTGANVHIRSGSGATDDNVPSGGALTGLGNLIIGYDEPVSAGGEGPQPRTGSHNLIVGAEHTCQSFGGFVAGWRNLILAPWASVSGGAGNDASGEYASVSGGLVNTASGKFSSVSGGVGGEAGGESSSVSGGSDVSSGSDRGWAGGAYHTP